MNANSTILTAASHQWATRPDDERYLSLADLRAAVLHRKSESWTATPITQDIQILPASSGGIEAHVFDSTRGEKLPLSPTHYAFGQLAQYASAPAAYLRTLPAELAAINLQWGLDHASLREDSLILAQSNGTHALRAMTSTSYGRIWDAEVVDAVIAANHDNRWQIPAASYATTNPKRATTLYAGDRNVFIFLIDPVNVIEVGDEKLFRGFMVWNSEVGAAVFGLTTFLYRYVCDNRLVWGATEVRELRIRHTGGAPDRFAYEGQRFLAKYAEESTAAIVAGVTAAQQKKIPIDKNETVAGWLQKRGFTKSEAVASVDAAKAEEGRARTIWDIVNGVTAFARSISNADTRVALETKAGKLMEIVA